MNSEDLLSIFDLVIQGPLNNTSLQNVCNYHTQFKNIIVSHWKEDLTDAVKANYNKLSDWKIVKENYEDQYKKWLLDRVKNLAQITSQPLPDLSKLFFYRNDSNFFYSIASTYEGLKQCTSPYVIKMRSDEYYLNLDPLKEMFLKDTKKMVCGNIFFKPWKVKPYHIGDHLFVAEREALLKTYDTLLKFFRGHSAEDEPLAHFKSYWSMKHMTWLSPEQILATAYLNSKGCPISAWNNKETFLKHFDVVDINQLSPYVSRWVHGDMILRLSNHEYPGSIIDSSAVTTYSSDGVKFSGEVSNIKDVLTEQAARKPTIKIIRN